jgi:PAS domain S-box-containing protein
VFWDLDGTTTQANDYFLKLVGYSRAELLAGQVRWKDMTPSEYAYVDARAIEEMNTHGFLATPFEKEYLRKDGSRVPVLIGSTLLAPSQSQGVSFILDVSERKELRQKDEFLSMASHELKTPLTSIVAYTDLLRLVLEQEGSQQALGYVLKMEAQLEKLTRLVSDLLNISRVQADKLTYAQELVVMDDLVREVAEDIQLTTPRHRILIERKAAGELIGDRDRLGQVVLNLLSNAIKYSPQAETVVVSLARTPEEIAVSVQDFGIGIPAHCQVRIFERFYRGSSHMEKRFPGLGIGLYIAQQIIAHHGGRIWVESVEGQGSTFTFALPLQRG